MHHFKAHREGTVLQRSIACRLGCRGVGCEWVLILMMTDDWETWHWQLTWSVPKVHLGGRWQTPLSLVLWSWQQIVHWMCSPGNHDPTGHLHHRWGTIDGQRQFFSRYNEIVIRRHDTGACIQANSSVSSSPQPKHLNHSGSRGGSISTILAVRTFIKQQGFLCLLAWAPLNLGCEGYCPVTMLQMRSLWMRLWLQWSMSWEIASIVRAEISTCLSDCACPLIHTASL